MMQAQTSTPYLDQVLPAIDSVAERLTSLLSNVVDPALPVPGSPGWNVQDVVAHLATVVVRYSDGPEGRGTWLPTPVELPVLNDLQLEELVGTSLKELSILLGQELTTVAGQIIGYGSAPPSFRFHGQEPIRADVALGLLLGELVVHGRDIAEATRKPWPIDPHHVGLIIEAMNPILPGWVRPERVKGLNATFEIRLRRQATHTWVFHDGRLQINPPSVEPRSFDAHISGDPATVLLVFYRREPQWRQIVTGRMLAWGRKPWLALTLTDRFHTP
jgi:uncharacterized protein (TIGR03083 family)